MTTTKPTPTEAHYVALRVIAAMLRDPKIGAVACNHAETARAVVWLCTQFGGIEALGEASQLIGKEHKDLRRMYEMGMAADDLRSAVLRVLDTEVDVGAALTRHRAYCIAERLSVAMFNHVEDMFIEAAMRLPSKPEDPLPDACLAISSEE